MYSRKGWIPNVTNTHSEYATFIAIPSQQRLHERAQVLTACPVTYVTSTHQGT